jgi:hypothetical protein
MLSEDRDFPIFVVYAVHGVSCKSQIAPHLSGMKPFTALGHYQLWTQLQIECTSQQ